MKWILQKEQSITSTQMLLRSEWQQKEHAQVVWALEQSSGQGRNQNLWESQAGGLYFSVLLKPDKLLSLLPWRVWVSLIEVLESYTSKTLTLKAPNDILYKEKKLAGFLIDAATQQSKPLYYIIGCGINVHQTLFSKTLSACALENISTQALVLEDILKHWLKIFENHLQRSDADFKSHVFEHYALRNVRTDYTSNRTLNIKDYWHETVQS